jgi:thiamine-phosphate pyrophosphorylase
VRPFRLSVIADRGVFAQECEWLASIELVAATIAGLDDVSLQVRIKGVSIRERGRLAALAATTLGPLVGRAVLNGTPAEAALLGFGAAHLPEEAIPIDPVAPAPAVPFGASIHSRAALDRSVRAGAAYVQFGPVFDAGSKPVVGAGVGALSAIASASPIPVVAVGGMSTANAAACFEAGAAAIAVVTGVLRAGDPAAAITAYRAACPMAAARFQPARN